MKKSLTISLLIFSLFLINCSKKKNEELISVYGTYLSVYYDTVPGMKQINSNINIYGNEQDFLSKNNSIKSFSLENGRSYKLSEEPLSKNTWWFRAEAGKLNNLRNVTNTVFKSPYISTVKSCSTCPTNTFIQVNLYATPTRLQLNVLDNGVIVKGAKVAVYLSEQDYLNNKRVMPMDSSQLLFGYYEYNNNPNAPSADVLDKFTDDNGIVIFEKYEPRQYWFRVTNGAKSNAMTTYKTTGSLPDDPNVTTVMDIGIK